MPDNPGIPKRPRARRIAARTNPCSSGSIRARRARGRASSSRTTLASCGKRTRRHTQIPAAAGGSSTTPRRSGRAASALIAQVIDGVKIDGVALANQGETVHGLGPRAAASRARWPTPARRRGGRGAGRRTPSACARGPGCGSIRTSRRRSWWLLEADRPRAMSAPARSDLADRSPDRRRDVRDHASTAARTLLCDIDRPAWSAELCELFGIPHANAPGDPRDRCRLRRRASATGSTACRSSRAWWIRPRRLIGPGLPRRGDAKATFGTGCFVYVNSGAARPRARDVLADDRVAARRGDHVRARRRRARGRRRRWRGHGARSLGDAIARRASRGVVCVPALVGLGAPHWDGGARAAWLGMSSATTRATSTRASSTGSLPRRRGRGGDRARGGGIAIAELRVDGGLTRDARCMQLQADILGRPIAIAEEDEATVVGACALAALRMGTLDEAAVRARKQRTSARYEPRKDATAVRARFDGPRRRARGYKSSV